MKVHPGTASGAKRIIVEVQGCSTSAFFTSTTTVQSVKTSRRCLSTYTAVTVLPTPVSWKSSSECMLSKPRNARHEELVVLEAHGLLHALHLGGHVRGAPQRVVDVGRVRAGHGDGSALLFRGLSSIYC